MKTVKDLMEEFDSDALKGHISFIFTQTEEGLKVEANVSATEIMVKAAIINLFETIESEHDNAVVLRLLAEITALYLQGQENRNKGEANEE